MLYNVYHSYDVDGGFGDAVRTKKFIGLVEATEKEIKEFLSVWNKPRIYERPYSDLYCHMVSAEPVRILELSKLRPYDPAEREWPDLPEDAFPWYVYDGENWIDPDVEDYKEE